MNIRFYNAKILTLNEQEQFEIIRGELWVNGDSIRYVGESKKPAEICAELKLEMPVWEREIDVKGNLLMPGFKNAHAHTYMTFLRSYADDLPLQEWLYQMCFPKEDKLDTENIRPLEVLGIMEYLTSGITTSLICVISRRCMHRWQHSVGSVQYRYPVSTVLAEAQQWLRRIT